jgi:hypothetical protein
MMMVTTTAASATFAIAAPHALVLTVSHGLAVANPLF